MATTIQDLEERVDALYNSVLQMQANLNPVTERADTAYNGVQSLTPYTETKTAYIGDTEVVFTDVVSGNLTVYVTDGNGNIPNYTVTKAEYIKVTFNEPLESVATVTISIS